MVCDWKFFYCGGGGREILGFGPRLGSKLEATLPLPKHRSDLSTPLRVPRHSSLTDHCCSTFVQLKVWWKNTDERVG